MPKDYSIGYKFKGDASGYKKAMVEMNESTKKFSNSMKQTRSTIIGAFSTLAVLNFSREAMKLAATAEGVKTAFEKIGGSKKILEDIRTATRGVIDESDLMGMAIKAQNFKIPLTDLATYLKFASNRAIEAGGSITEFSNKIIDGLGRKAVKSLIPLQISAKDAKAAFSHEGLSGALELVNKELDRMGTVTDTAVVRYDSFSSALTNLKESWGEFLNNSELVRKSIIGITEALQNIADRGLLNTLFESKSRAAERAAEKAKWDVDRMGEAIIPKPSPIIEEVQNLDDLKKAADEAARALEKLKKEFAEGPKRPEFFKAQLSGKAFAVIGNEKPLIGGGMARGGKDLAGTIDTEEGIRAATEGLGEQIQLAEDLKSAFENLFAATGEGFKGMAESFANALRQMVAQLAAKAAIFGILTMLTGGTGKLASWATGVLGGRGLGKFMGLASGAIVSGPTLANVGEYANAKSDPEVISPLSKLKGLMGGQTIHIKGEFKKRGKDLYMVIDEYARTLNAST